MQLGIRRKSTLCQRPDSPQPLKMDRRRTFSHFTTEQHKQVTKTPEPSEMEYAKLAQECLNKNYDISCLKPFGFRVPIQSYKAEVKGLKNTHTKIKDILVGHNSIQNKLNAIIGNTKAFYLKKKRKRRMHSQIFVKSVLEDDHLGLIQDFSSDQKADEASRNKTIQYINSQIMSKYGSFAELPEGQSRHHKSHSFQQKIIKFKKQKKVATKYSTEQSEPPPRRKSSHMEVDKSDYGVYSRSANKTFHYQSTPTKSVQFQVRSKACNPSRIYYKNYLKSYSKRHQFLQQSADSMIK